MIVNLTPNETEITRRTQIAKDNDFEYCRQDDPKLIQEIGIYQCSFNFNFSKDEFIENLDSGYLLNKKIIDEMPDNFDEMWITPHGVADNIEQIKEHYTKQINDPYNDYTLSLTPVFQDLENKGKGGGWRWHKWGTYIGKLNPQHEYLDDEDLGKDFQYIICFTIHRIKK